MGTGSERMIENQKEKFDHSLAEKLGISYDDLLELNYEITTEESNDGLIYNYILEIKNNVPDEILDKIHGLEDGIRVWFAPWELYDEDI
jgi:hypothetical protein